MRQPFKISEPIPSIIEPSHQLMFPAPCWTLISHVSLEDVAKSLHRIQSSSSSLTFLPRPCFYYPLRRAAGMNSCSILFLACIGSFPRLCSELLSLLFVSVLISLLLLSIELVSAVLFVVIVIFNVIFLINVKRPLWLSIKRRSLSDLLPDLSNRCYPWALM